MCRGLFRATLLSAALALCAPAVPARAEDKPVADRIADARAALEETGYQFSMTYIGEGFANVRGGVSNGAAYTGRLDLGTTIDLEKVMGWTGATFHANMFQIQGDGLSRGYVGNLFLVSGVESLPATRLYELWIEQKLLDGRLSIRFGQQGSDVEFFDSQYDDIFINSALGWPGITGVNLPTGGPSPALAVPGTRIKAALTNRLTAYLGVFDGSAAPPQATVDPQIADPHGILFRVNDPPWWIGQLKYKFDIGESRLPATITGGAWYHMMSFADQRFGADGLSLADPDSSGETRWLRRNNGIFMVYEQLLARARPDADKGVAFFMRASIDPSDRNLISAYVDGGFLLAGFSDKYPDDRFGIAGIFGKISSAARALDRDTQIFTGTAYPIRDYEAVLEITYQHVVNANLTMQPMFQYIAHPGGGAVDPNDPTQTHRIKDSVVFGMRTILSY